jgi:hypothetical protein
MDQIALNWLVLQMTGSPAVPAPIALSPGNVPP